MEGFHSLFQSIHAGYEYKQENITRGGLIHILGVDLWFKKAFQQLSRQRLAGCD